MRILKTLSVVGIKTPSIVPIFSAFTGFPFDLFVSGVPGSENPTLALFQNVRLRVGLDVAELVPVEYGPGWEYRRPPSSTSP